MKRKFSATYLGRYIKSFQLHKVAVNSKSNSFSIFLAKNFKKAMQKAIIINYICSTSFWDFLQKIGESIQENLNRNKGKCSKVVSHWTFVLKLKYEKDFFLSDFKPFKLNQIFIISTQVSTSKCVMTGNKSAKSDIIIIIINKREWFQLS